MKIHEYQAKEILKEYGVAVPGGVAAENVDDAVNAAKEMKEKGSSLFVVKAMIHAGGRGRGVPKTATPRELFCAKLSTK